MILSKTLTNAARIKPTTVYRAAHQSLAEQWVLSNVDRSYHKRLSPQNDSYKVKKLMKLSRNDVLRYYSDHLRRMEEEQTRMEQLTSEEFKREELKKSLKQNVERLSESESYVQPEANDEKYDEDLRRYLRGDEEEEEFSYSTFFKLWKDTFVRYLLIGLVGGFIIWTTYRLSTWFSSLTFTYVAKWGFHFGFLSATLLFALGYSIRRSFSLRPDHVYRAALKRALEQEAVRETIGLPLKPSKFRAYSYVFPDINSAINDASSFRRLQFWKPRHMHMIFQLQGKHKSATISCDVSKLKGWKNMFSNHFKFHSLVVDIPDDEDRLILRGEEDDTVHQGRVRWASDKQQL